MSVNIEKNSTRADESDNLNFNDLVSEIGRNLSAPTTPLKKITNIRDYINIQSPQPVKTSERLFTNTSSNILGCVGSGMSKNTTKLQEFDSLHSMKSVSNSDESNSSEDLKFGFLESLKSENFECKVADKTDYSRIVNYNVKSCFTNLNKLDTVTISIQQSLKKSSPNYDQQLISFKRSMRDRFTPNTVNQRTPSKIDYLLEKCLLLSSEVINKFDSTFPKL
ncbi:MAG: hypothetical protein MHPSP_002664 [Paramarteilia canceri]